MKIKTDNKADIEAWAKDNNIKKLKVGICKGATLNGSICAGSGMARASSKAKWIKDNPKKVNGNRAITKTRKAAKHKERLERRKLKKKLRKERKKIILAFKADLLNESLDLQLQQVIDKD